MKTFEEWFKENTPSDGTVNENTSFSYQFVKDAFYSEKSGWRTDEPPKGEKIMLLCVLFDDEEHRTLKENSWGGYNRYIFEGYWYDNRFVSENYHHASGDPFYQVVAWKEKELGERYYPKCIGELRDY